MSLVWSPDYAPVDGDFADVSLLLLGEGTNGSTTILDSSSNNLSVTANGDAQIINTVATPFSPTVPSDGVLAFDGTGDYLRVSDNTGLTFGANNFTVECWVYNNSTGGFRHIVGQGNAGANPISISFYFYKSNAEKLTSIVADGATTYLAVSSGNLPLNTWTHVAFVRNDDTVTNYIDGVADGTVNVTGVTVNDSSNQLGVGSAGEYLSDTWSGYISNLRITKGVARYTENFDVPTAPFPILSP
ncbi:MAG: LamG domain-containing protein, partial [Marivivens sp.]|nr:LamG domain-containing protein [Marivivens sp.]